MRRPKSASRAVLSVLLLFGFALAGCASEETPDQVGSVGGTTTTPAPTPSNTTSGPEPTETTGPDPTGGNGTNTPPTAELTADVTEGEAPVDINFSIDAADEDGDGLTWTLDADGDGGTDTEGTEANLPFTFTFTFDTAGSYTALLVVSDGEDEVEETLDVVVTAGGAASGPVPEPLTWSGTAVSTTEFCLVLDSEDDGAYFYYDRAIAGIWKYKAEPADAMTEWWDGEASYTLEGAEGTIPADTDNVAVCPNPVPGEFKLTLYHPDYVFE